MAGRWWWCIICCWLGTYLLSLMWLLLEKNSLTGVFDGQYNVILRPRLSLVPTFTANIKVYRYLLWVYYVLNIYTQFRYLFHLLIIRWVYYIIERICTDGCEVQHKTQFYNISKLNSRIIQSRLFPVLASYFK